MTTFFLVRHAVHELAETVLVGRMENVHIGETGRRQAKHLAHYFVRQPLALLQSSPRERARETAELIAARARLPLDLAEDLDEVDFGGWTGGRLDELAKDAAWQRWNNVRSQARPPGGESMCEVQDRIIGHLESLRSMGPKGRMVLVTHAELIRAAVLHYLRLSLDRFFEIAIDPARVTRIAINGSGGSVLGVNEAISP